MRGENGCGGGAAARILRRLPLLRKDEQEETAAEDGVEVMLGAIEGACPILAFCERKRKLELARKAS